MSTFRIFWSLLAGLVLACGGDSPAPKPPELGAAFPNLPLPPEPELISRSGGADALQLTLHSPSEVDRIVEYYRSALTTGSWRLVSDIKNPDGSVTLYAEQKGHPLWARIWKANGRSGTMVELTGAVVSKDSTKGSR